MGAFQAVDWLAFLAFGAGILLGIGVGWLLRGWRLGDAEAARPSDAGAREPQRVPRSMARPAASEPAALRRAPRAISEPMVFDDEGSGPLILLIDDRIEMLGIHAAYLRKYGYRTVMAENGDTGLFFARAHHPTLIVLDHSMPDRTGVEVARELKADPTTADIPILLMTALSYGAVGMAAIEAGCAAFLPKPIEPSRLLREIEAHTPKH